MDESVVMQTSPLVQHLIDLTPSDAPQSADSSLAPFGATHSASRIAAADKAGFERGRLTVDAELSAKLREQEQRFARDCAALRQQWVEAESERLHAQFLAGMASLRTEMASALAQTMTPFIAARLRSQAAEDLAAMAETLIADAMPLTVEVSGPADLTAVLMRRLEALGTVVRVVPGDATELRVRADARLLQTRVADGLALIEDSLK
jgi:hypothetical protein